VRAVLGLYPRFTGLVLFLPLRDPRAFHREAHEVPFREASTGTVVRIALALPFGGGRCDDALRDLPGEARRTALPGFDPDAAAWQVVLEQLAGLVVAKALAVDNVFVFVVVLDCFAIPPRCQHRVPFYGIPGALVFRALIAAAGSVLMQGRFIVIRPGAFLILAGPRIRFAPGKPIDPERDPRIRLLRKFLPVTPPIEGQRFFLRRDGRVFATPPFAALAFIEVSGIVLAVDSVPATVAITKEPRIVCASNDVAILGPRVMDLLPAGVVLRFRMLEYGPGPILVFVGLKVVWLSDAVRRQVPDRLVPRDHRGTADRFDRPFADHHAPGEGRGRTTADHRESPARGVC
jgi:tellurite resistance protein TerC